MKRVPRNNPSVDAAKLLANFAAMNGETEYSEQVLGSFSDYLGREVRETVSMESRVRGLRTEAMFGLLAAGLNKVALIKAEDGGEAFHSGDDLSFPDWRIVLQDRTQLLVEVKSFGGTPLEPFSVSDKCVKKWQRYAELTNASLYVAIFWERPSEWTLCRISSLKPEQAGRRWRISFSTAMAKNEMGLIGDRSIATAVPLSWRVLLDPDKSESVPDDGGRHRVSIAGMEFRSQGRVLRGLDAKVAFRLLWYGRWDEADQKSERKGDKLVWVESRCAPDGWDDVDGARKNGCYPIGSLSGMLSRAYVNGAPTTIHARGNDPILTPGRLSEFLPEDFQSKALPIAHIYQAPNFDFNDADDFTILEND